MSFHWLCKFFFGRAELTDEELELIDFFRDPKRRCNLSVVGPPFLIFMKCLHHHVDSFRGKKNCYDIVIMSD